MTKMLLTVKQASRFLLPELLMLLAFSCVADKGNYEYRDLSGPEISGIEKDISVLVYDELTLTPILGGDAKPEDEYTYEWKVISHSGNKDVTVIGKEKNLIYEVVLTPDKYTLYFTVTEKSSGLFWREEYQLTVSDATTEGWMVLCSDDGRTRLDMISMVTSRTYRDILSENGTPEWNGPRKIQWLSKMADSNSPYYLLTDEGATRLGKNNFEWKEEYDFSFEVAVTKKLTPYSIVVSGFGKMTVSGTEAYYCEVMGIDGLYGSAVNKDFRAAPYVGANIAATSYASVYMLYDIDNKRFMAYCPLMEYPDLGGLTPLVTMEEMENIAISMKGESSVVKSGFGAYPEGCDCIYMENTKYDPGNGKMGITYSLLSDDESVYLCGIQLGDLLMFADCSYVLGRTCFMDLGNCRDIALPGNLYAFSSLKNYMYYASGDKVYRADLSASPVTSEVQITLPGERITCLKFNLFQKSENYGRSYDLIVGSERGGEGVLRIYEGLESEGDFSSVTPEEYDGFATIVDVTYKERI